MSKSTKAALFILLLAAAPLWAQVPQGITYQAVACDATGVELVNQQVRLRASILRDGPNGAPQWIEVHSNDPAGQVLKTDAFGLFTINIGQGSIQPGGAAAQFQDIDWSYGNLWLKMELDATGSGSFVFIGANRMWSVPYSFYSRKAEAAKNADNATNAVNAQNAVSAQTAVNATNAVNAQTAQTALDDLDKDPTNELRDLKFDAATNTLSLVPSGQGSPSIPLPVGDASPTNELQNLTYDPVTGNLSLTNSTVTVNLGDKDKDPENELQDLKWDPATSTITLVPKGTGGGSVSITIPPGGDPSTTNELQGLTYNPATNTISISPAPTGAGLASTITLDDNDKDPKNELQSLQWDPVTKSLSIVNNPNGPTTINIPGAGDPSETNELQTLSFDPVTNTLSLSPPAPGQPVVKLDDQDEDPANEIQSLTFDPATNKISITNPQNPGQPAGSITLDDADKNPTNELQSLSFNPATHEISITPPPASGPATIAISDADSNPTNEIQSLQFDSLNRVLSISGGNSISLRQNAPGFAEYPDCGGKPDFRLLLSGNFTVPPGKILFLTAAGRTITIVTPNGPVLHPNSPAMPMLAAGTSVMDCNCTGYLLDGCTNITPLFVNLNDPSLLANGYTVPPGKVFVLKSGIEIDEGRIDVSNDGGVNWKTIVIALSPYEAASRAPTFPAGTKIRRPSLSASMMLTGYLFDN